MSISREVGGSGFADRTVLEQIDSYTRVRRMARAGFIEAAALDKLAEG